MPVGCFLFYALWNLTLRALVRAPTYLTPFGRGVVDFYVSRGVKIDNVTFGNGT